MHQRSPNEDTLISHHQEYQRALGQTNASLATLAKAQANLAVSLRIGRKSQKEIKSLTLPPPIQAQPPQLAAGDASTSAVQAMAQGSPPKGHKRQATGEPERPGRPVKLFPLRSDLERRAYIKVLLDQVASLNYAASAEVVRYFENKYPRLSHAEAQRAANQLLVCLHEYHLMCALHGPTTVSPVLPKAIEDELRPVEEYYEEPPTGTSIDFRSIEAGYTLRFGAFIHRIDQARGASQSVYPDDHKVGPLLTMLLAPGTCPLTSEAVIARVVAENIDTLERLRQETLPLAIQAQKDLHACRREVAQLLKSRTLETDQAAHKRSKRKLDALRVMQDTLQECRDCHQAVLNRCDDELIDVGVLDPAEVTRSGHGDGSSPDGGATPARSPQVEGVQAQAQESDPRMEGTPDLLDDRGDAMDIGSIHSSPSPVQDEDYDLLDEGDETAAQFQDTGRDASSEVGPTMSTGGETPSTGVNAGMSGLSMSLPEASSLPEDPVADTAPPAAE